MNRSEAFTMLIDCAGAGFITLRGIARDVRRGEAPDGSENWPGQADAEAYAAEVASTCHFIRARCSKAAGAASGGSREVLARAWAGSGELGRHWIASAFAEAGRGGLVHQMESLASGFDEPGRGFLPRAAGAAPSPPRRWQRTASRWCEDIALEGLVEIHRLVTAGADEDEAARAARWHTVAVIADACHRVPFPTGHPLAVGRIRFPRALRDGWTRTGAEGLAWCHEQSAALPYPPPRSVRRVLPGPA